jgi:hypothetical protein
MIPMTNISVKWGSTSVEQATIQSLEELEQTLDHIQDVISPSHPVLATIEGLHTHFILIGLGSRESIVVFQNLQPEADGWTIEYISTGDKNPSELYSFWLHGEHHSEFPGEYILSTSLARQILREYYHSHALPDTIAWETNRF